jgi:hypothetical protein
MSMLEFNADGTPTFELKAGGLNRRTSPPVCMSIQYKGKSSMRLHEHSVPMQVMLCSACLNDECLFSMTLLRGQEHLVRRDRRQLLPQRWHARHAHGRRVPVPGSCLAGVPPRRLHLRPRLLRLLRRPGRAFKSCPPPPLPPPPLLLPPSRPPPFLG